MDSLTISVSEKFAFANLKSNMPWSSVLNHDSQIQRFRQTIERDRLANTYLFVGPSGIGKKRFAQQLAEVLLCENRPEGFESCGTCAACQQVAAKTHPDLMWVSKPDDSPIIPVKLFIGDKEHRRQEGLCHDIGLKPFRGGRKIAIIDDADCFNQEGANSLLKTLEEPPPKSLLILIGSSEQQQLPTILSRSQVIRFDALSSEQVLTILQRQADLQTEIPLKDLAIAAEGSVEKALRLADQEVFDFRRLLLKQLSSCDPAQRQFSKSVTGFVEAAGKDGFKKRNRMLLIADFAVRFFRLGYQRLMQIENDGDQEVFLSQQVDVAMRHWQNLDLPMAGEICGTAIDRCLDFQRHVLANANTANAVEAWLIDLGQICRGQLMCR